MAASGIENIFKNIKKHEGNKWVGLTDSPVDYPEESSDICFDLEDNSFWFRQRFQLIQYGIEKYPPQTPFVDLGGGNGYITKKMMDLGIESILLEPSSKGAANAEIRGINCILHSEFNSSILKENSIPSVGLFDVIEHIENPRELIKNLYKALIPSGRVYITVPAYKFLWSREDVEAHHHTRYTLRRLRKLMQEEGFKVCWSTYFFAYLIFPIFILRSLPYRLKGYQRPANYQSSESHHIKSRFLSRIFDTLFKIEMFFVKYSGGMPLGGSIFLVAEKPRNVSNSI